jgi:hypothetical protein
MTAHPHPRADAATAPNTGERYTPSQTVTMNCLVWARCTASEYARIPAHMFLGKKVYATILFALLVPIQFSVYFAGICSLGGLQHVRELEALAAEYGQPSSSFLTVQYAGTQHTDVFFFMQQLQITLAQQLQMLMTLVTSCCCYALRGAHTLRHCKVCTCPLSSKKHCPARPPQQHTVRVSPLTRTALRQPHTACEKIWRAQLPQTL